MNPDLLWRIDIPFIRLFTYPLRIFYHTGVYTAEMLRLLYGIFIVKPVFSSIAICGRRVKLERLPYIRGRGEIVIGDEVYISGRITIHFASAAEGKARFIIGEKSFIGNRCTFSILKEIRIGDYCLIGAGTRIQDNDGHPLNPYERKSGRRLTMDEALPVIIGDNVWIAPQTIILKGVSIGDNSIVGAGSVVTGDLPSGCIAAGNPARVIREIKV